MVHAALDLNSPFWRFSCAIYAAPGVADACLDLQDEWGTDVNLLLLAAWLGAARGWRLDVEDFAATPGAAWRDIVIQPLRIARRWVKQAPELDDTALIAFHAQLLQCELAAERIRQAELFRWAVPRFPPKSRSLGMARTNLATLVGNVSDSVAALDKLARAAEVQVDED